MERVALGSSVAMLAVALTAMPLVCPAAAQRITIGPTIGILVPLAPLQQWSFFFPLCDIDPCDVTARMNLDPGLSLGLTASANVTKWLGVEVAIATTGTTRRIQYEGFTLRPEESQGPARYTVAAFRARVVQRLSSIAALGVALGASLATVSSSALTTPQGDTSSPPLEAASWGTSVAATVDFAVSRRSQLQLAIADNMYHSTAVSEVWTANMQHDLQVSIGFRMAVTQ